MEVSPNKPTVHGPDRWFTGEVWIDAVAEGHGARQHHRRDPLSFVGEVAEVER